MAKAKENNEMPKAPKAPSKVSQWMSSVGAKCRKCVSAVTGLCKRCASSCRACCAKLGAKRASLLGGGLVVAVLAVVFATRWMTGGGTRWASAANAGEPELFYELRIYTAAPGKMDALNKRFRDHTLRLFEKHGIKNVAYWTAVDEKHQGRIYCVVAYPDRKAREKIITTGISKDPEYLKTLAESEKDGKLTSGVESVLMMPADYSPMK